MTTIFPILNASSHSGRTDKNGGHWDRNTGTYHYHNDGQTSSDNNQVFDNSPSPTASPKVTMRPSYEYSITLPSATPVPSPAIKTTANIEREENEIFELIGITLGVLYLLVVFGVFLYELFVSLFEKYLPPYKLDSYEKAIAEYNAQKKQTDELFEEIIHFELQDVPEGFTVGSDGLPKEKSSRGWGKAFTMYQSKRGKKIHHKYGCCNATEPRHIIQLNYHLPYIQDAMCKKCCKNYNYPSLGWYNNYVSYAKLVDTYEKNDIKLFKSMVNLIEWNKKCNTKLTRFIILFSRKNKENLKMLNKAFHNNINQTSKKLLNLPAEILDIKNFLWFKSHTISPNRKM